MRSLCTERRNLMIRGGNIKGSEKEKNTTETQRTRRQNTLEKDCLFPINLCDLRASVVRFLLASPEEFFQLFAERRLFLRYCIDQFSPILLLDRLRVRTSREFLRRPTSLITGPVLFPLLPALWLGALLVRRPAVRPSVAMRDFSALRSALVLTRFSGS